MSAVNIITSEELFERLESIRRRHAETEQSATAAANAARQDLLGKRQKLEQRQSAMQQVIDSAEAAGLEPPAKAAEELAHLREQLTELLAAETASSVPSAEPLPALAKNLKDLKFFFSKAFSKDQPIVESADLKQGLAAVLEPRLGLRGHGQTDIGARSREDFPGYVDGVDVGRDELFLLNPSTKWCVRGRIPTELSWVGFDPSAFPSPKQAVRPPEGHRAPIAMLDPTCCRLYMLETCREYEVSKRQEWVSNDAWGRSGWREVPVMAPLSVAEFVDDLPQLVRAAQAASSASGGVSLDEAAPEDPILRCVYDFAQGQLIPESQIPFKEIDGQLSLEECRARVLPHLEAFRDAPWSAEQEGDVALLKHVLGSRSPVYAWNESLEGLYGFRVRSSDHTWIRGELYLAPSGVLVTRGTPGRVQTTRRNYSTDPMICNVGDAWIRVWQTK
jgi:hypothetical protein